MRSLITASLVAILAMVLVARANAQDPSDPWATAPAVLVSPLAGTTIPTTLTESGAAARVRIHLSSRPTTAVDLVFASDGQVAADLPRRTFLPEHWSSGIEVNIAAVPDGLLEGAHHGVLQVQTISNDPDYDGLVVAPLAFDIVDADRAGVVIEPDPLELAEGDGATSISVRLAAMPPANVTVQLRPDPAQFTLGRQTLTFTPGDWNVAQHVPATAIDDQEHEPGTTSTSIEITTRSTATVFDRIVVPPSTVRVYDDDPAGIDIDGPPVIQLDEARATSGVDLRVRLRSTPRSAVAVTLADAGGQVRFSAPKLTFTPSNWDAVQTVTVTPVDDALAERRPHTTSITVSASSNDGDYGPALRTAPRAVEIQDDDAIGVELEGVRDWPAGIATPDRQITQPVPLREGGATGRVRLRFASAPTHDMTIAPVIAPLGQVRVTPPSITITAGTTLPNGAEFDVVAVNDNVDEPDPHSASIAWHLDTSDTDYAGLTTIRTNVAVGDDDEVGVVVTPAGVFDTVEGGPQRELSIALTSAPTSRVVINLLPDAQTTAVAKSTSIRFDPQAWDVPQTVSIAARDDDAAELSPHSGLIAFDVASSDLRYNDLAVAPIDVRIRDNDTPGVLVTATGADTRVAESGQRDVVNVRLRSRPVAPVNVHLADASGQLLFVGGGTLTIEPGAWSREHPVDLGALQDDVLQGTRTVQIVTAVQSTDPSYASGAGAIPAPLDVVVVDDEQPGIVTVQSAGDTAVTESGGGDSYTIALASQPSADVTISLAGDTQVTAAPAALTFTAANWRTPQTVTVRAVQDDLDEPETHTGMVRHAVRTAAAGWDPATKLPDVGVRITDDDTSGVTFAASSGRVRVVEGGASATVTMVLTTRPSASVEIVAKADDQVKVDGALTFGPDAWKQPRTLTIRAVDDQAVTGERVSSIGFVVRSDDALYRVQRIPQLDVTVVDNDVDRDDEKRAPKGNDGDADANDEDSVDQDSSSATGPDANRPSGLTDGAPREGGSAESGTEPASGEGDGALSTAGDTLVAGGGGGATGGAGTSRGSTADGELAAAREHTDQRGRGTEARKPSALGRWAREHIGLLAISGGLLGMAGIGGGWLALRNPTRMARHVVRGFDSDRL